jgi:hypothetical protein
MDQIFAHSVSVAPYKDPENGYEFTNLLIVSGKGWEGDKFELYINEEEAEALFHQLGYYLR